MDQTLSQYKTFFEVARCENISKASRILYVSQPAVSKAIKNLEKSLGVALFDRTTIGLELTKEGKILYDQLSIAFNSINEIELKLKTFSKINFGHLTIGVTEALCNNYFIPYLNKYTRAFPNIRLSIIAMYTTKAYQRLSERKIDIALIHKKDMPYEDIEFIPLDDIHLCFVASKSYMNYFNKVCSDPTNYFDFANILLSDPKTELRNIINKVFDSANITPNQILEVNNLELLVEFAKNGVGIALVIKDFVKNDIKKGNLIEIPINLKIPNSTIGFAYNKSNITRELLDFLSIIKQQKKRS